MNEEVEVIEGETKPNYTLAKFLGKIFCHLFVRFWWVYWSNFRYRKTNRFNTEIKEEDNVTTLKEVKDLVKRLYSKFKYTRDGLTELGDAIVPPPQNYQYYLDGEVKDDCDGFHSLVYHCIARSGHKCYLLSVLTVGAGHCVLLFKLNNKWYVNDYTKVYKGFDTPQEAIADYNERFVDIYDGPKTEVYYNMIIEYNYEKGKFKNTSLKKIGDIIE